MGNPRRDSVHSTGNKKTNKINQRIGQCVKTTDWALLIGLAGRLHLHAAAGIHKGRHEKERRLQLPSTVFNSPTTYTQNR